MDVSSRRFMVRSIGGGLATVRDRNAPYHCHSVALADLPTVDQMARMTEAAFDRAVSEAVYG